MHEHPEGVVTLKRSVRDKGVRLNGELGQGSVFGIASRRRSADGPGVCQEASGALAFIGKGERKPVARAHPIAILKSCEGLSVDVVLRVG
jgi:hypothetical protein